MRAEERDRRKSWAALDLMEMAGSVDVLAPLRGLMERRPEITEEEARSAVTTRIDRGGVVLR